MAARLARLGGLAAVLVVSATCWAGAVHGHVLNPDGGAAAGARVWLIAGSKILATATTDSRGGFNFSTSPSPDAVVAAMPPGASIAWATLSGHGDGPLTLRARRPVDVRGTVVGLDGKPIEGAEVVVAGIAANPPIPRIFGGPEYFMDVSVLPGMKVTTGKDGVFAIAGIAEDALPTIRASAPHLGLINNPNLLWSSYSALPGVGEWAPQRFDEGSLTLQMAPLARIAGVVTHNGTALVGAKVTVLTMPGSQVAAETFAGPEGRYTLEVETGRYSVSAEAPGGLLSAGRIVEVRCGDVVGASFGVNESTTVEGDVPLSGLNAEKWSAYAMGAPTADNPTWMDVPSKRVPLDAGGHFRIHVPAGKWQVGANSTWGSAVGSVAILPSHAGQVVRAQLTSYPAKKLRVTVCDHTGAPVPGATVVAHFPVRADAHGEAMLDQWQCDVEISAVTPALDEFGSGSFQKGADTLRINLVRGVPASGLVLDDADKPIEGASCEVEVDSPPEFPGGNRAFRLWEVATTDATGRYRFHLPAGSRYILIVEKTGCGPVRRDVPEVPRVAEVRVADVRLEPNDRTAEGRVVDPEGNPLVGVSVVARWEPFDKVGFISGRLASADATGAFKIGGLPRKGSILFDVAPSSKYGTWGGPVKSETLTGVRIVGALLPPVAPTAFAPGMPLFSPDIVDWIQGDPPTTGNGDLSILFATAFEPGCEALEHSLASPQKGNENGARVVLFDAALSVGELKAYVAKLGIQGPVARVKSGPSLGWGGEGLFARFSVPCVPSWGIVDLEGRLHPAEPAELPGGSPGQSTFPLRYRMRTDSSPVFGAQAKPTKIEQPLPAGIEKPRFYTIDVGDGRRGLAVGVRAGLLVVAIDEGGAADPANLQVYPMQTPANGAGSAIVALSGTTTATGGAGAGMVFFGHYTVEVNQAGTPNENVRVYALGSRVGEVVIGGTKWNCTISDTDSRLGFTAEDETLLTNGTNRRSFKIGEWFTDGGSDYRIRVDALGTRVTVDSPPEFDDLTFTEAGLIVAGEVQGERWTIVGSAGQIRIPKTIARWTETIARKAADGKIWSATFRPNRDGLAPVTTLGAGPLVASTTVAGEGDTATLEVRVAASGGLLLSSVLDPSRQPAQVVVRVLDASGKVIKSLPMVSLKPGVWSIRLAEIGAGASRRLTFEFGPFKVEAPQIAGPPGPVARDRHFAFPLPATVACKDEGGVA